jgi:tripartite-type tricarboxylate transporter receptor subunit TctC
MKRCSWKCAISLLIGLLAAAPAFCQQWPERSVRIVVPFPPGGNTDTIARITADYLAQRFGKPVIVDNRAGAGGAIAAELVAKSPADGYTLFLATLPQMAILPAISNTRYDPVKDFALVSIVGRNMFLLALSPSLPARTLKEFVAHVKEAPRKLPYASGGSGTVSHLSVALLLHRAGIEMVHVPYKGGPPALAAVLAGDATLYFGNLTEVTPQARAGKVRIIAVSGEKRAPQFPDVPTVAEQGYPDFRTETWNGIAAPAGTPAAVIARLADEIGAAARDSVIIERLDNIGVEAVGNTPTEFAKVLEADIKTWGEAVRISGARVE